VLKTGSVLAEIERTTVDATSFARQKTPPIAQQCRLWCRRDLSREQLRPNLANLRDVIDNTDCHRIEFSVYEGHAAVPPPSLQIVDDGSAQN